MLLLIYVFVLSFLTLTINAQTPGSVATVTSLTGSWPPLDTPPPYQAEWGSLIDFSKVPNASVVTGVVGQDCPVGDPYCNWSCTGCTRNTSDITACPSTTDWGITFDDGPTIYTPQVLDYLDSSGHKITFFTVASRIVEDPTNLIREFNSGHQIGVHTWSHTSLTTQTNEEIIAEIKWSELAIQEAIGIKPTYMRPPYGDIDDRGRAIITQLGYKIVIWDLDTNDWMSADVPDTFDMAWVAANFTEWVSVKNYTTGHISLEHDLYNQTAAQASITIPIVANAGYNVKPIYQCMGDSTFFVQNTTPSSSAAPAGSTSAPTVPPPPNSPNSNNLANSASASTASPTQKSNAISRINNNNYYSFLLVLFTLSYFIL